MIIASKSVFLKQASANSDLAYTLSIRLQVFFLAIGFAVGDLSGRATCAADLYHRGA
jgi:hypothetical protein